MADKQIGPPEDYPPDVKYTRAYAITRVFRCACSCRSGAG